MRLLHANLIVWAMLTVISGCGSDDDPPAAPASGGTSGSGAAGGAGGSGGSGNSGGTGGANDSGAPDGPRGLSDVGTSGRLDYANADFWACSPNKPNSECAKNLDATEVMKDGTTRMVPHQRATNPAFDCFYVYPTVLLNRSGNMTDFTEEGVKYVRDPLMAQGAPFTRICEVYAPLYRQVGFNATNPGAPGGGTPNPALGAQDVKDAFDHYLRNDNRGRKFVLVGHSQGSGVLTTLLKDVIAGNPEVRAKMISAVLIGSSVVVPAGQKSGGTFADVPFCSAPGETGCVIAYASFAKEAPPVAGNRFGLGDPAAGTEAVCTNPALLANNSGRYTGSYVYAHPAQPIFVPDVGPMPDGITTPFLLYRDIFRGECKKNGNFHYLEISMDKAADDTRATPPYRNTPSEAQGFGMHIFDYFPPTEDLINTVKLQAEAAK
jgi:hypothetical protein